MMALVRLSAEQNSLNPAVLATRKQLEMLLLGDTDSAVVQGWRKQLVGRQLLEFLNGDLKLCIRDGRLTIDESS
jgi:ribonuclease D